MSLRAHFQRLFAFDHWANKRVIRSMESLNAIPEKPLGRMAHIIRAQEFWIARIADGPPVASNELFPVWTMAKIVEHMNAAADRLNAIVESEPDESFERDVRFINHKGDPMSVRLYEILFHLITHGAHHRGQLGCDLNHKMTAPITVDLMAYFLERSGALVIPDATSADR